MSTGESFIIPLGIDGSGILKGLQQAENGLDVLAAKAKESEKVMTDAFNKSGNAAGQMDKAFVGVTPTLDKIKDQAKDIEADMNRVKTATQRAVDDAPVNRFRAGFEKLKSVFRDLKAGIKDGIVDGMKAADKETKTFKRSLSELETEMKRVKQAQLDEKDIAKYQKLEKELNDLEREYKELRQVGTQALHAVGNAADTAGKKTAGLGSMIAGVFGGNVLFAIVQGLFSLGREVIEITSNFQRMEAVLTNTLGSNSAAKKAMNDIVAFAAKTPFQVEELTDSFIKFANRGIVLTQDEMTKLGDIAASQGKSFDQLTEAALDAQTGEFERLKEFGIRGKKAGDEVTLAFKGVTKTVKNNATEIQAALESFGELKGVKGGMEAISKTLGGQLSNMKDNFTSFLKTIGDGASGGLAKVVSFFNDILSKVNELVKSGAVSEFFAPITNAVGKLFEVGKRVVGVIVEWGERTGVFKKMKELVEEGVKALGVIYDVMGDLINATIDFFTETKAGQVIVAAVTGAFKLLLNVGIGVFKAIQEIPLVFIAMKAVGSQAIDNLVARFKILGENLEIIRLKVKKAFTFDDDAEAALEKQIEAAENAKQKLKADIKDPAKAGQEAYAIAKAEQEGRQKAAKEASAKKEPEAQTPAAKKKEAATAPTDKKDAERKAREAQQAAKELQEQIVKYTRDLKDAQIEAMQAGFDKERAVIENNYQKEKQDLEKEKLLSKEAGKKRIELLDQLQKNKEAKLKEINEKEAATRLALEFEAQKEVNNLRKDGLEKTLEGIRLDYEAQKKAIHEKYKDRTDLELGLLDLLNKDRAAKEREAKFNSQIKQIEDESKMTVAILEAYGIKNIDAQKGLYAKELELTGGNKRDMIAIQKSKNLILLTNAILTQEKLAKVAELQYGKDSDEAKTAKLQVEKLKREFREELNDTEKIDFSSIFDFNVDNMQKSFGDSLRSLSKGAGKGLGESMGLTESEQDALVQSFSSAFDLIGKLYAEMIQGQIDERERQIEELNTSIDKAEEAYDRELELQRQGYANNAAAKAKEVEELKKLRDKEQQEKERLHEKQRKLAQVQIAVSTAVTLANLIAGAAQAIAAHASIPFVGVAFGLAAAAALVAGYLGIKAQSKQATADQSLGEGGTVTGKSHSEGGVKYRAINGGSGVVELENGEFVTNKKSSEKHNDFLHAINNDDFSIIDTSDNSFKKMLADMGISLSDPDGAKEAVEQNNELGRMVAVNMFSSNSMASEKYLKSINDNTEVLANDVKERETVTIEDGYKVVKKGNFVRRIQLKPEN